VSGVREGADIIIKTIEKSLGPEGSAPRSPYLQWFGASPHWISGFFYQKALCSL